MTTPNYPFNLKPDIKEVNHLFRELMSNSGDMINTLMKLQASGAPLPNSEKLSPDLFGCEKFFIDFFVNADMGEDFRLIARDFFQHEYTNLDDYDDVAYFEIENGNDWPEGLFQRFTLNLMVNAVNGGSDYTKALILYLYKTYYKKEYQALKRFRKISYAEVLALSNPNESGYYLANMARVLFIARLSGISINDDCAFIYAYLNERAKQLENVIWHDLADVSDLFETAKEEIETRFDINELYKLENRVNKYVGKVLNWLGYSSDLINWCDENEDGVVNRLALTLSFLRKSYPGKSKEYSVDELMLYSMIFKSTSALTCNMDWLADCIRELAYGESGTAYFDEYTPKFKPEDVPYKRNDSKNNEAAKPTVVEKTPQKTDETHYSQDKLLEEIDSLRHKVHKLESDNNSLRNDLCTKKTLTEENRLYKAQIDGMTRELAALRSYVYNLTEEDEDIETASIDRMKDEIRGRHIVVVGGHPNWVSKLKSEFPDWDFVNPEAGGTSAVSVVDKADRVYFFTDTISHSKYYQFMNAVRDRKIRFSYIHGVNIDKNIQYIYRDLEEE